MDKDKMDSLTKEALFESYTEVSERYREVVRLLRVALPWIDPNCGIDFEAALNAIDKEES